MSRAVKLSDRLAYGYQRWPVRMFLATPLIVAVWVGAYLWHRVRGTP